MFCLQIGAEDDAYYINKDGKYPFAIMLPATTGTEGPIRFTPAKETVRIDLEYPDFAKWVESNGATIMTGISTTSRPKSEILRHCLKKSRAIVAFARLFHA